MSSDKEVLLKPTDKRGQDKRDGDWSGGGLTMILEISLCNNDIIFDQLGVDGKRRPVLLPPSRPIIWSQSCSETYWKEDLGELLCRTKKSELAVRVG